MQVRFKRLYGIECPSRKQFGHLNYYRSPSTAVFIPELWIYVGHIWVKSGHEIQFLAYKSPLIGNQDTAALDLSGYSAPTGPVRHRRAHKNICRPLVGRKIVIYILISSIWIYAPTSRKSDIYYHIISIYKQPDRHARYFKCLNSLLWHPGEQF